MSATERTLRKALGSLLRAAEKAVTDRTPEALEALESATAAARATYWKAGPIVTMDLELPVGRRGPHGEHTLNGCRGAMYDVRKGDRWVLWCDRCGYIPRRWRARRRVDEPNDADRVYCRDCLCYAAENRYCPAMNTSRAPEDSPFIDDCFIPLPDDMKGS